MAIVNKEMKFLVVDDMTNMRRTIRNMLRYIGYDVIEEASDGSVALRKMQGEIPDFLILDWNMPRMAGIDLVQRMREDKHFVEIPILMVTAEVQETQIVQAAESDIDGYIIKPFIAVTLEEKINSIMAKRNSPSEFDKLIKGGMSYREKKEFDKAIEAFGLALKASPQSARVRHLIGETYGMKGDMKKSEQFYEEAVKINPQYIKVHQSLGELYQKTGNSEKAIASIENAARISPNSSKRQATLGKLYIAKGDVKQAEKAFKQAVKVEPNNAALKTVIGEIYLESGQEDKAADSFKESLELKEDINVYNRLGIALRRKHRFKEAIEQYQKALKVEPRDEGLHYNIGRAYIEANDKVKAMAHFKKALEIKPGFEDAKIILEKIENL